jgi:ElaB/YqjD/DUF883 family membrane-anchored ribosome-binding protein
MEEAVSSSATGIAPPEPGIGQKRHEVEQKLADEIKQLWAVHVEAQSAAKKTKAELKAIRQRLGERLHEMKRLLARPGRNGQWPAWLKEHRISRASADRLVQRHAATLPGYESPREAISEPTTADVMRLFDSVWPRLEKKLTTRSSAYEFLVCLVGAFELGSEILDNGLLVLCPESHEPTSAAASLSSDVAVGAAGGTSSGDVP